MCIAFDLFGQETKEDGGLDIVFHLDTCTGVRIAFLAVASMFGLRIYIPCRWIYASIVEEILVARRIWRRMIDNQGARM